MDVSIYFVGGMGGRIVCHKKAQKAQIRNPVILCALMYLFVLTNFWLRSKTDAGEDVCELALRTEFRKYRIDFEVHQPDVTLFYCGL